MADDGGEHVRDDAHVTHRNAQGLAGLPGSDLGNLAFLGTGIDGIGREPRRPDVDLVAEALERLDRRVAALGRIVRGRDRIGPAAFGRKENDGLVVGDGHARLALHRDLDGRRHRILPFGEDGSG